MEIAIIGAGIGGLTAALSLHAAGFRPTVYEAVKELAPLGVGINLLPHATRELTELGILQDLQAIGVEIDELLYLNRHGKQVWQEPRGSAAGYDWPQIAIHRGELQMLLLRKTVERLGADSVRFGWSLAHVEDFEDQPTAQFSNGESVSADCLVAADGIHSVVRRCFYPGEGLPKWNGVTLYRSTTLTGRSPRPKAMIWAGHARQKFVGYPIKYDPVSGETLFNWICDIKTGESETPAMGDWNKPGDRSDFLSRYEDWHWTWLDVPEVVRNSGKVFQFPMVDRDPLPRWTFGPITLLGDAAHPMYPIGSNGATQAIIDARALAWHLATAPSVNDALARYDEERRPATSQIVLMNRANGPDQVLELAEQRAPGPDDDLERLVPLAERQAIADDYKKVAGFYPDDLNKRRSYSTVLAKS